MAEPVCSREHSFSGFHLQLDKSNSLSHDMERSNSCSSEEKIMEASFSHFSGLEALNPQKRELLEARFSAPRSLNQDSNLSNASSVGSDKDNDQVTPGNRPDKHGGRKRKAPVEGDNPSPLTSKTGRTDPASAKITEYFKQNELSPSMSRSPQNLLQLLIHWYLYLLEYWFRMGLALVKEIPESTPAANGALIYKPIKSSTDNMCEAH